MARGPVTDKVVSVDLQKDGRVLFQPSSRTETGQSIFDGLPEVLESFDDPVAVGQALQAALDRSNARVLPRINHRTTDAAAEFLEFLGVKTWGAYMRGVRCVKVLTKYGEPEGTVSILPYQNMGARGGFVPIDGTRVELAYTTSEELGRAVQEAMTKAI